MLRIAQIARVALVVCAFGATSFGPMTLASAQTSLPSPSAGKALLERGVARFADGAFVDARALLERARAALPRGVRRARAELYLGFVHAAENRAAAARAAFERALADHPALRLDPQRHKPALVRVFASVRRARVGTLLVDTDRVGADVRIDGATRGRAPVSAQLLAGAHSVALFDGTRLLRRQRVIVTAGATTRLVLAVATAAPRPAPVVGARRRRGRPGVASYSLAGASAAAAAVAIALGLAARSDRDDACALLLEPGKPCAERSLVAPTSRARYGELHERATAKTLGANISWGIAGALLAASIVALVLEWRAPIAAEVAIGAHGALAGVRVAF